MATIAREISWRRARYGWNYVVGHIPSEINLLADCISRLTDPNANYIVPSDLADATSLESPLWDKGLWACA